MNIKLIKFIGTGPCFSAHMPFLHHRHEPTLKEMLVPHDLPRAFLSRSVTLCPMRPLHFSCSLIFYLVSRAMKVSYRERASGQRFACQETQFCSCGTSQSLSPPCTVCPSVTLSLGHRIRHFIPFPLLVASSDLSRGQNVRQALNLDSF